MPPPTSRLALLSALLVASSAGGDADGSAPGGPLASRHRTATEEGNVGRDIDGAGATATVRGSFYDLSDMTEDEKLFMAKAAYHLAEGLGAEVDWDRRREEFVRTVREGGRTGDGSHGRSDAEDDSKHIDDGVVSEVFDAVVGGGSDVDDSFDSYDGLTDADVFHEDYDPFDGEIDDTLLDIKTTSATIGQLANDNGLAPDRHIETPHLRTSRRRRLQDNGIDGDVFDGYTYSLGACPDDGSLGVPCAPDDLPRLCNKYDRDEGSFRACMDACAPAFCCIHDAPPDLNTFAPNCHQDENCPQYNYCYIAWWKLHDTVGPALFLRVEQDDEFYDITAEEIASDVTGDPLFEQVLLHHFDDMQQVIEDGTVDNTFSADRIFLDEDYWVYPVADIVVVDPP
ncbi:hypothetical protein ACHAWF_017379 [Thalassiosira exigua]